MNQQTRKASSSKLNNSENSDTSVFEQENQDIALVDSQCNLQIVQQKAQQTRKDFSSELSDCEETNTDHGEELTSVEVTSVNPDLLSASSLVKSRYPFLCSILNETRSNNINREKKDKFRQSYDSKAWFSCDLCGMKNLNSYFLAEHMILHD